MAKQKYTIQDIAKLAKVGVGTVSRVLNEDKHVKQETREQVLKVIDDVGYRPNFAARYIKTKKSNLIGLIADQVATTPFANNIITGIQKTASEHGKVIIVIDPIGDKDVLQQAVRTMIERDVEGIIYAAMYHQEVTLPKEFYQIPTVLVDCFTKDKKFSSVVPDEYQGGFDATSILLQQGHRQIAIINIGDAENPVLASKLRLKGYEDALNEHGFAFDQELVRHGIEAPAGYKYAHELLKSRKDITALFCATDRIAMGAYDAIKELNLSIPEDIAIVGFDNQEVISEHLRPALSTMELPHAKMGRWAIEQLLTNRLESTSKDIIQHTIHCDFISRDSH